MSNFTFKEYAENANRTINQQGQKLLLNGALGLAGEAGEAADLIKKHVFQGHDLDAQKVLNEIGDVIWYLNALCIATGYTLEDAAIMNNNKLAARYPNGFTIQDSLERRDTHAEYDIPQRGCGNPGGTVQDREDRTEWEDPARARRAIEYAEHTPDRRRSRY